MATNAAAAGRDEVARFRVGFDGAPEKQIELSAYVFASDGALMASAPIDASGVFELRVRRDHLAHARLFVAPTTPKERGEPTISQMERVGAYEPAWRRSIIAKEIDLGLIPRDLWIGWPWCLCRVRGRVVRPVVVNGVSRDMPVCNARVHICEVDRWRFVIWRLPDALIRRLRDDLVRIPWPPVPPNPPDPAPDFVFDPGVIDPTPEIIARMQPGVAQRIDERFAIGGGFAEHRITGTQMPSMPGMARMRHTMESPSQLSSSAISSVRTNVTAALQPTQAFEKSRLPLSAEAIASLSSDSMLEVRRSLIDNVRLIRPWLCLWPWIWPYFYECDEIMTIQTDNQGRFDRLFFYPCSGDHPDLYFWVEYCIGGVWTTVHHPPIPCNTHWDYVCGTEVTIRVTDPRVPWCGEGPTLPGLQVAVLTVGNNVSMPEIQGAAAGASEGLTTGGEPFGGSLEPHVVFGDGLIGSGITHYRWSYRRLGSGSSFAAMDATVVRHYGEEMADGTLTFKPFLLGPDSAFPGQNLFRIRPAAPPMGPGVVSSSWTPEVDARSNTASAYFLTHLLQGGNAELAQGKYELKLELFRSDGSPVDWTAAGITAKVPTTPAPFGNSIVPTAPAPAERLFANSGGHVTGFRLVVHVDNTPCGAALQQVTGDPANNLVQIDEDCGFIQYKPGAAVKVSFIARHPHNFATFGFDVNRAFSINVPSASLDGTIGVTSPAVLNGFSYDAGTQTYTKIVPVVTMLSENTPAGHTPCDRAVFAETLNVWAMATDGWNRLSYLDASAPAAAFALEPLP